MSLLESVRANGVEPAVLEIAVATLANGACSGVQEFNFPSFFEGFAAAEEQAAAVAAITNPSDASLGLVTDLLGRYAERVRGGQMVLADVTGDGVPDLVQIAKLPNTLQFRAGFLIGSIDASGLRFRDFTGHRR